MNGTELPQLPKPFEPGTFGIAFFSRGRGRGHAMPDMAIARELLQMSPGLDIRFASYSGGAETFRSCGYEVIDLHMPDEPPMLTAIVQESRIVRHLQPRLVISHEELAALPASQVFDVPCLFITDFFQDPNPFLTSAMQCAREIIFIAERGIFTEPPFMGDAVRYVGPAIRRFHYGRQDRARARQELGIPAEAAVALCQPGGYSESHVPVADLVVAAWNALPHASKRLIWIAWRDYDSLRERFAGQPDIQVLKEDWAIDRLMAASDLLITKGNRTTVCEAAFLGLPSISISAGVNWPDDVAIARVRSNSALRAGSLKAEGLAQLMAERIAGGWTPEGELPQWDGLSGAVRAIASHVERIGPPRVPPNPISVVIVDDHPVVRDGLSAMLSGEPDINLVGAAGTGAEALEMIAALRPAVVVVDLLLPDIGGAEVIRRVCGRSSDTGFVVLTSVAGDEEIYRALEAGAGAICSRTWRGRNSPRPFAPLTAASATFPRRLAARSPKTFRARMSARAKSKCFNWLPWGCETRKSPIS